MAKGRALASIAVKAAGILPLVEAANAKAIYEEKRSEKEDTFVKSLWSDPNARQVVQDYVDLLVKWGLQ